MKKLLFLIALISFSFCVNAQIITTIAGNGSPTYSGDGAAAILAGFRPHDIKVDATGNIYITDRPNSRIRKINTSGIITTVVGNGLTGFSGDGGLATAAKLNNPNDIAFDNAGNMYIADGPNNRIRKVSTSGIISTIAGTGGSGYSGDGGPAIGATMTDPYGIAVDTAGNIYIADSYNNRIRKINTSGIINTIAGTGFAGFSGDGGLATTAELSWPNCIILDDTGNIYFGDADNNRIRKINTSGIISTIVGSGAVGTVTGGSTGSYTGDGGPAIAATINLPFRIALDNFGNLYIADFWNNCIRKVNRAGIISTVAGNGTAGYSGDGGLATAAEMDQPCGVFPDHSGNIFVADWLNSRIRKISPKNGSTNVLSFPTFSNGSIAIYPNPNAGKFTVNIPSPIEEKASVIIINILGEKVKEIDIPVNQTFAIDLTVQPGIYLLNITTSGNSWNERVVIK